MEARERACTRPRRHIQIDVVGRRSAAYQHSSIVECHRHALSFPCSAGRTLAGIMASPASLPVLLCLTCSSPVPEGGQLYKKCCAAGCSRVWCSERTCEPHRRLECACGSARSKDEQHATDAGVAPDAALQPPSRWTTCAQCWSVSSCGACDNELAKCSTCDDVYCDDCGLNTCSTCDECAFCPECTFVCQPCGNLLCEDCKVSCTLCSDFFCGDGPCSASCLLCDAPFCQQCQDGDEAKQAFRRFKVE